MLSIIKYDQNIKNLIKWKKINQFAHLLEYRNLFVLACLTGLRFSDFSILQPEDLRKDMLYKKQEKSDHWVVISLQKEAKEIFTEQFKEKIPSLLIQNLTGILIQLEKWPVSIRESSFLIKKATRLLKLETKYEWITSHTARRSFCTNEFLAGIPVKLIMKISDHKMRRIFISI